MSKIRIYHASKIERGIKTRLENLNDHHYLMRVMRISNGEIIKIYNDVDGEWNAKINIDIKNDISLTPIEKNQLFIENSKFSLAFSLLKKSNNNLVIQKATELNVSEIYPIISERSMVKDINIEKFITIAKESSEQCGRIDIPKIHPASSLNDALTKNNEHDIIVCDDNKNALKPYKLGKYSEKTLLVIGPEGGFSNQEKAFFATLKNIRFLSLGPLTLRAETASIVSLFAIQQLYGEENCSQK